MPFWDSAKIELLKTFLTLITLGVGWILGQRIIAYWDMKKKRQELDIATSTQFHKLYGEFKEVSRLWRHHRYAGEEKKVEFQDTTPVELLKRATAAEGGIESIILKLATERHLNQENIRALGLFRQAFQKLREKIRSQEDFVWTSGTREYVLFNDLASQTACIISENGPRKPKLLPTSSDILKQITSITAADWNTELGEQAPKSESFRAGAGAMIANDQGLVLALERSAIPGAWQMVQGGVNQREEPYDAALREVDEETGISADKLELLDQYPQPLAYELPPKDRSEKTGRGQVQYWYLFRFTGSDQDIHLNRYSSNHPEFRDWKWLPLDKLINSVVPFRKPIYQQLEQRFAGKLPYSETSPDVGDHTNTKGSK